MTEVSVCLCSLLLVPREGGGLQCTVSSRPKESFTVGTQTSRSTCQGPSYWPSPPSPHLSKSAFLQVEILVKMSFVMHQELKLRWGMDASEAECAGPNVHPCDISLVLLLIMPERLALMGIWPEASEG